MVSPFIDHHHHYFSWWYHGITQPLELVWLAIDWGRREGRGAMNLEPFRSCLSKRQAWNLNGANQQIETFWSWFFDLASSFPVWAKKSFISLQVLPNCARAHWLIFKNFYFFSSSSSVNECVCVCMFDLVWSLSVCLSFPASSLTTTRNWTVSRGGDNVPPGMAKVAVRTTWLCNQQLFSTISASLWSWPHSGVSKWCHLFFTLAVIQKEDDDSSGPTVDQHRVINIVSWRWSHS